MGGGPKFVTLQGGGPKTGGGGPQFEYTICIYIEIWNSEFAFHITVQFVLAFCSQKETILNATGLTAHAHYVLSACCVLALPLHLLRCTSEDC